MWGCHYCTRLHKQWDQFDNDINDVVPLVVRSVELSLPDQAVSGLQVVSNWVDDLSLLELRRAQLEDPIICIVIDWIEHSYEPTTRELQLTGPITRALWLTRDHLKLQHGKLYYSWADLAGLSDC